MLDIRYLNLAERTGRRRWMELQARAHRLPIERIDALTPEQARRLLPQSRTELGELGLQGTWVSLLRKVAADGSRNGATWLVVLEDDAMLVRRFGHRAEEALRAVPDGCILVQLAYLDDHVWRPWNGLKRNLSLRVKSLPWSLRHWMIRRHQRRLGPFSTDLRVGAHVTAVRVAAIPELAAAVERYDTVIDRTFLNYGVDHPGRALRLLTNLGYQLPFQSDLHEARKLRERRRRAGSTDH